VAPRWRISIADNPNPSVWARAIALTTLLLLPAWQCFGAEVPNDPVPLIIAALQELDANDLDENWYFTMSLAQEKENQIIRSDPMKNQYERRELLQVDGKAPDKSRLREFREEEIKRVDDIDPKTRGYGHLVDSSTLQFVSQRGELLEFFFKPRINTLKDAAGKMRGTLLFNNTTNAIEKIEVRNTQELSPAFSVTVDSYRLSFLFQLEQGARFLRKMESHAVGTVGFLKSFDQLVVVDFSDFRPAENTALAP
jgi:hypothetical protein